MLESKKNCSGRFLLTVCLLLVVAAVSTAQTNATGGNNEVANACTSSDAQSTTIVKTDIKYEYMFLLTASLLNVAFDVRLTDPDSAFFKSSAAAFENEITSRLSPLIQNPPPSPYPVNLDAAVILFRLSELRQSNSLTLECVLSTDERQITAEFLLSQLRTVSADSTDYRDFVFRVSSSVNYCLREVIKTQEGAITFPVSRADTVTETLEFCPIGTKYVGERPLGRRSCRRSPISPGHAQWEPYICTNCGKILKVDDILEAIYNEIQQNRSLVMNGVTRATAALNEVTDITKLGFNWLALILEFITGLNVITTQLLDAIVGLLSNLLRQDSETFRLAQEQYRTSTRIIQSLATLIRATTLANSAEEFSSVHPNIAVSILDVPPSQIQGEWISFGSVVSSAADGPLNEGNVGLLNGRSLSLLPNTEAYVHVKVEEPVSSGLSVVRTMFVIYHNAKLFQSLSPVTSSVTSTIAGRVVSADIDAGQTPLVSVVTRFKPLTSRVTNVDCRSWDVNLNNEHGDWTMTSCNQDNTETSDRVKCQCDRLTAFTIFAEPTDDGSNNPNGVNAFVRVAAIICFLCLLAAVILYLVVKELRIRREIQILCCLFSILAAFYIILAAGIDQSSGPGCIVMGALLHYCLLTAVAWMGVAWVNLYDLSRRKQWAVTWFMVKVSGPIWVIPFLFVIITVLVNSNHYITPTKRCFLSSEPIYNIIVALILPAIAMLVAMGVAFGLTAHNVSLDGEATLDEDPESQVNQGPSKWAKFWNTWQKYILYSAMIALNILTFVFILVMANSSAVGAEYIFGILAIANGVLVVVAFCIYRPDVREMVLIKLGYINGPDSKKFQPYWSTSKWQKSNRQSVLPELSNSNGKKLYLDDTQGSGAQTNQGFNPSSIPLSSIEMQRMGQDGVETHTGNTNGLVVKAEYHEPPDAEAQHAV